MEGEKDPRNLLICFQISRLIVDHLDFKEFAEDLFEVNFCYFPITFRAGPDDPLELTTDDLKSHLRAVITSTPIFVQLAVPILIEKLTSDSWSAKRDAMDTVSACAVAVDCSPFVPHLENIWDSLQRAMVNGPNESDQLSSLKCVRNLSQGLSTTIGTSRNTPPLEKFISLIAQTCFENLKTSELKYVGECGKLLMAAASSSTTACDIILKKDFLSLLDIYEKQETPSKKKIVLSLIADVIEAVYLVGSKKLILFKEKLLNIFTIMMLDTTYVPLREVAALGIYKMLKMEDLLVLKTEDEGHNEVEYCANHLLSLYLNDSKHEFQAAGECLRQISIDRPEIIFDYCLPALFRNLFEPKSHENKELFYKSLELLKSVSISEMILSEVTHRLFSEVINTTSQAIKESILRTLLSICTSRAIYERSKLEINTSKVLSGCIADFGTILSDDVTYQSSLEIIGPLLSILTRNVDQIGQEKLIGLILKLDKNMDANLAYLYECCFCYVRPQTPTMFDGCLNDFMKNLIHKSVHDKIDPERFCESVGKIIASFLNKKFSKDEVTKFCETLSNEFFETIAMNKESELRLRNNVIIIYSWAAKSLSMSSNPSGYSMVSNILKLVMHPVLAKPAIDGFEIVMKPDPALSKESFAKHGLLFNQRLYMHCIPIISEEFEKVDSKNNYLKALSHILRNIPSKSLMAEVPRIFPMLIFSLTCNDEQLKLATLPTIKLILNEAPSLISDKFESILKDIISLTLVKNGNSSVLIVLV